MGDADEGGVGVSNNENHPYNSNINSTVVWIYLRNNVTANYSGVVAAASSAEFAGKIQRAQAGVKKGYDENSDGSRLSQQYWKSSARKTAVRMKCLFWSPTNGWGRLAIVKDDATSLPGEGGATAPDVFVHHSALSAEVKERRLTEGSMVLGDLELTAKGLSATNVKYADSGKERDGNDDDDDDDDGDYNENAAAILNDEDYAQDEELRVGNHEFPELGRRYQARCVFWNYRKQWGKVLVIGHHQEIFCHASQIKGKHKLLRLGEIVDFVLAREENHKEGKAGRPGRFEARNVKIVKKNPPPKKENQKQQKQQQQRQQQHGDEEIECGNSDVYDNEKSIVDPEQPATS